MAWFLLIVAIIIFAAIAHYYSIEHIKSITLGPSSPSTNMVVIRGRSLDAKAIIESYILSRPQLPRNTAVTLIPFDPLGKKKIAPGTWIIDVNAGLNGAPGIWSNRTKAAQNVATSLAAEYNRHMSAAGNSLIETATSNDYPACYNYLAVELGPAATPADYHWLFREIIKDI